MAADELREALNLAAMDETGREARRAVCRALAAAFERTGLILRTAGHLFGPQRVDASSPFGNGDDRLVALGYLGETATALIAGAADLIEHDNPYAAAALNRQLVEVEYLAWAFAEDQEEASSWLRSTRPERRQRWQPRHLRDRSQGRFRGHDYQEHCEVGGHPTPEGLRAVFGPWATASTEIILFETANHGTSTWWYFLSALATHCRNNGGEPADLVSREAAEALRVAEACWREADRLPAVWGTPTNSAR